MPTGLCYENNLSLMSCTAGFCGSTQLPYGTWSSYLVLLRSRPDTVRKFASRKTGFQHHRISLRYTTRIVYRVFRKKSTRIQRFGVLGVLKRRTPAMPGELLGAALNEKYIA